MRKPVKSLSVLKKAAILIAGFCLILLLHTSHIFASSIAQNYQTDDNSLSVGMAAALSPTNDSATPTIERASTSNDRFVGIVTTESTSLITLTTVNGTLYVTTTGQTTAFVSDINGDIKKGDALSVSPLKGVMMRASDKQGNLTGNALEDFPASGTKDQQVTTEKGEQLTVKIAPISIQLDPRANSAAGNKSLLKLIGEGLTGRPLNNWQVITSFVIFLLLLTVEGSLIYGAIHSTIISLGRNPLAHKAVYKQLFQVVLIVLAVLLFGIATIYAILEI